MLLNFNLVYMELFKIIVRCINLIVVFLLWNEFDNLIYGIFCGVEILYCLVDLLQRFLVMIIFGIFEYYLENLLLYRVYVISVRFFIF